MPKGHMGGGFAPQSGQGSGSSANSSAQFVFNTQAGAAGMSLVGTGFQDSTPATMQNISFSMFGNESRDVGTSATDLDLHPDLPLSLLTVDGTSSTKEAILYAADTIGKRKTIIIANAETPSADSIDIIPLVANQMHTTITLTGLGASVELVYAATHEWVVVGTNDGASIVYDPAGEKIEQPDDIQPPPQPGS